MLGLALLSAASKIGSSSGGGTGTFLLILSSSGITAILVSVITAVVNRRKLKAEEVNIISQAAGAVVDRLEKENVRLSAELELARNKQSDSKLANDKLENEVEDLTNLLGARSRYVTYLEDKLNGAGIKFDKS